MLRGKYSEAVIAVGEQAAATHDAGLPPLEPLTFIPANFNRQAADEIIEIVGSKAAAVRIANLSEDFRTAYQILTKEDNTEDLEIFLDAFKTRHRDLWPECNVENESNEADLTTFLIGLFALNFAEKSDLVRWAHPRIVERVAENLITYILDRKIYDFIPLRPVAEAVQETPLPVIKCG